MVLSSSSECRRAIPSVYTQCSGLVSLTPGPRMLRVSFLARISINVHSLIVTSI
jgi:hypothetical protein